MPTANSRYIAQVIAIFNQLSAWFLKDPAERFILFGFAMADLGRVAHGRTLIHVDQGVEDFDSIREAPHLVEDVRTILAGKSVRQWTPSCRISPPKVKVAYQLLRRTMNYVCQHEAARAVLVSREVSELLGLTDSPLTRPTINKILGWDSYSLASGVGYMIAARFADAYDKRIMEAFVTDEIPFHPAGAGSDTIKLAAKALGFDDVVAEVDRLEEEERSEAEWAGVPR